MTIVKLLCLIAFSTVPYIFSLDGEFVFDDSEAIVNNVDLTSNQYLGQIFEHDFWGTDIKSNISHKSYRPLTILSFRLNKYLDGDKLIAKNFKIFNLILHSLVTLLVYYLLNAILFKRNELKSIFTTRVEQHFDTIWKDESFISSLIFAIHPIHVEAVSGIVGRADVLSALFFIIAILVYNKILLNDKNIVYMIIYYTIFFIASILSMLSKEIGITTLIFCSIYDTILEYDYNFKSIIYFKITKEAIKIFFKKKQHWFIRQCVILTFLIVLLFVRMAIMDFKGPQFHDVDNPASFSEYWTQRVITYNYIYFINILILIWPQWLCFDWSMGCIYLLENITDPRMCFVMLLWITIGYVLYKIIYTNNNKLSILLILLIIPFLPASNVIMPVGFVIAERILYIPSIGFCALVANGFTKIVNKNRIVKILFVLYVTILTMRTIERSNDWRDEKLLYNSALKVCPNNAKVHYNIGKNAGDMKDFITAENEYMEAIRLHPRYYQAMNNLANLLKDQSRFVEAKLLLKTALDIKKDFPAAWMNLGIVLANLKEPLESEKAYMEALKYRKKYADCYYNLGNLYLDQNKHDLALKSWSEATKINPYHIVAWSNTLALLDNSGKIKEALELVPKALSLLPNVPAIHFNIANLMGKSNEFIKAEKHFLEAIRLKFDNVPSIYYTNLGVLYHRWKKRDLAIDSYKKALVIDPQSKSARKNLDSLIKS